MKKTNKLKEEISNIEDAVKFLESNGINVRREKIKGEGLFKKWWNLSFPYQDLDEAIPNKEGVIKFCNDNKELIESKYKKWWADRWPTQKK